MGPQRPKKTNLDPFFCKMSVSIWIRGKPFFGALIFTGHQIWPFLEGYGHFSGFEVPFSLHIVQEPQIWNSRFEVLPWTAVDITFPDLRFQPVGTSNPEKWPDGLRGSN